VFRPELKDKKNPFRAFLLLIDAWRAARQLVGYFFLVSFSPHVSGAFASDIQDIRSQEKRYDDIFVPPGVPPPR